MKKSLQHILYYTICVVSLIIALLVLWWVTTKPYTEESFISLMPHMVLIGLTGVGDVYYADIDVPMQPKWIKSGLSSIGDIAGSYGQLYTVTTTGSVPKYGLYDSSTQTSMTGTNIATKISVDDMNAVAGINGAEYRYSSTLTGPLTVGTGTMNSVALSGGSSFYVGSDGRLYYTASPSNNSSPQSTASGVDWKQVTYDAGTVCAIKTTGELWCADTNVENAKANFKNQGSKLFSSINLKEGRLVGVGFGTDNKTYYSNSYSSPTWTEVVTQPYTIAGTTSGTPVTFSKVIIIYPGLNSRRKRFKGSTATAKCNSNEELIDGYCYQPCPSGRPALGKTCPFKVKYIPAISSCSEGNMEFINDSCYKPCATGYTAKGQVCEGILSTKGSSSVKTVVAEIYSCPVNGMISGRYIRVRPSTLLANNKLCISSLQVKGADGVSLISTGAKTFATDGTCIDKPIGAGTCTAFQSYISGVTYDKESDGGKIKRIANLYWEIDLGAVKQIKTIEFTGCNYIRNNSESATTTGVADQITGMKIEVLFNSNATLAQPIATRTLGPDKSQTITFNYVTRDEKMPNRCYDECPKINGIDSMDNGDQSCFASAGGITHRSVSVPLPLPDPICGPVRTSSGAILPVPATNATTGATVSISNWVADPSDPGYMLSCDHLSGSVLKPLTTTFNVPGKTTLFGTAVVTHMYDKAVSDITASGTAGLSFTGSWLKGNAAYENTETPHVCVKESAITCQIGYQYQDSINTCVQDIAITAMYETKYNERMPCNQENSNWVEDTLGNNKGDCISVVRYTPCWAPYYVDCIQFPLYSRGDPLKPLWEEGHQEFIPCGCKAKELGQNLRAKLQVSRTSSFQTFIFNIMSGNPTNNFKSPIVVEGTSIARPIRKLSQCKCLNKDGTANTSAFIYNGKCVKCPSKRDVFYPKGTTTSFNWATKQAGYIANAELYSPSFDNLEDAKSTCETTTSCTGVTQRLLGGSSSGSSSTRYTMRGGSTILVSTSGEYSWKKETTTTSYVTTGKYGGDSAAGGKLFTEEAIPRAFADDYVSSIPLSAGSKVIPMSSPKDVGSLYSRTTDMVNFVKNSIGQAAALLSYKQSVERPDTYYTLIGLERQLKASIPSSMDNFGICVGPCDSEHSTHDPIQMYKSEPSGQNPLYVLYGTTCSDGSMIRIDKPSKPAIYTPAIGEECPKVGDVVYTKVSNYCIAQCPAGQEDTDTGCRTASRPRDFVKPEYRCPTSLTPADNVCVFPCGPGLELKGEYCEPIPVISAPNLYNGSETGSGSNSNSGSNSIKCVKTSQGYSTKYQGSSGSKTYVNKWLCDSQEDLSGLLIGYKPNTGTTYYINPNDIVCVSDDPTTGMYYCQTVSEAVNGVENSQRDDYSQTCDNLVKAYLDLSGTLDVLSNARTNAQNAKVQVANIKITLDGVYAARCGSAGSAGTSSAMCTQLQSQLNQLMTNMNAGSGATSNVLNPINIAIDARANLVAQMEKFHCEY